MAVVCSKHAKERRVGIGMALGKGHKWLWCKQSMPKKGEWE
jgi:hypothetical protein